MAVKVSQTLLPINPLDINQINLGSDDESPSHRSKDSSIDQEEKKHYNLRKSVV